MNTLLKHTLQILLIAAIVSLSYNLYESNKIFTEMNNKLATVTDSVSGIKGTLDKIRKKLP